MTIATKLRCTCVFLILAVLGGLSFSAPPVSAQSVDALRDAYSGSFTWDTASGTLRFTESGAVDFPAKGLRSFLARLRQMLLGATDQVAHAVWMVYAKRSRQVAERGGRVTMSQVRPAPRIGGG